MRRVTTTARPTISLIVPTIGRPSLARFLASLPESGLDSGDELLIVADGGNAETHAIVQAAGRLPCPHRVLDLIPLGGFWGQPARNFGMSQATKQWLVFSQDDNVILPEAFLDVKMALAITGGAGVHIFRVQPRYGPVVPPPGMSELVEQQIDADCIVCPNDPDKLGVWGCHYNGDFEFIAQTVLAHDGAVTFHPEQIAGHEGEGAP